jgi:transcription elongation factor Elf1
MSKYNLGLIIVSHKRSSKHREEILQSKECACFCCLKIFIASDIIKWLDNQQTAICPNCGVDSVIGDKSGYPITDIEYLKMMKKYWFE